MENKYKVALIKSEGNTKLECHYSPEMHKYVLTNGVDEPKEFSMYASQDVIDMWYELYKLKGAKRD